MPLINIIQSNSPQLNPQKDNFIDGAKVGDIFYAPTQTVIQQPLEVVPVGLKTVYAEWKPRTEGGGLVGIHPLTITSNADYAQGADPAKPYGETLGTNDLKKTTYVAFLAEIGGEWIPAMVALAVSGQKISRKLQTDIRKFRYEGELEAVVPPIFARKFELSAEYEENAKQEGYYNLQLVAGETLDPEADEALMTQCSEATTEVQQMLPQPQAEAGGTRALEAADTEVIDAPY